MSVNVDVVADAEVELDVDVDLAVTATATALEAGSGTGAEDGSDVEAAPLTADANYCKRQRKDGESVSKPSQNTGTALIHQTFNQMGNQLIIHEASGRCAAKWRQSLSGIDVCTYVWEKSGKKLLVTVAALFPFSDWPKKNIYGRSAAKNLHSTQFLIMPKQGCSLGFCGMRKFSLWAIIFTAQCHKNLICLKMLFLAIFYQNKYTFFRACFLMRCQKMSKATEMSSRVTESNFADKFLPQFVTSSPYCF